MKHVIVRNLRIHLTAGLATVLLVASCNSAPTAPSRGASVQPTEVASIGTYAGSAASMVAPVLGITLNSTGAIVAIEAGGAGEAAGLHVGDVVTALGDVDLTTALREAQLQPSLVSSAPIQLLKATIAEGKPLAIHVTRDTTAQVFDIVPATPRSREQQPTPTAVPAQHLYL